MSQPNEFRARIGRIRMKNGGAELRVFDRQAVNANGEDWRGKLIENARVVGEHATEEDPLVGYVLLGIYQSGNTSLGYRYDFERAPMPRMLIPSWIAEIIRRDMIVGVEARDTFNDMFYWQDGVS